VCTVARDVTARRRREKQISWYRDQLRILTSQLFLAEQRERRRTAQILHDQAGQLVTAAILRLDTIRESTEEPGRQNIDQVMQLLRDASQEIRSLTLQLSPPLLAERNLSKAVEWLARSFESQHGISVRVQTMRTDLWFGEEPSTLIYHSLRELLANVLKHAQATKVDIRLTTRPGMADLSVNDNGVGFDPKSQFDPDAQHAGGFGLFSIGERLTHLGGGLEIDSSPGAGTRVVLHIPLKKEA
jgi:signal transduction histidine kinase